MADFFETMYTDNDVVGCDGGGGALGHPKVYLELHEGEVVCPYCSRHFLKRDKHSAA